MGTRDRVRGRDRNSSEAGIESSKGDGDIEKSVGCVRRDRKCITGSHVG